MVKLSFEPYSGLVITPTVVSMTIRPLEPEDRDSEIGWREVGFETINADEWVDEGGEE